MFFHIQHFGKIIAAQLYQRLADFLFARWYRRPFLQQQDLLVALKGQLACQGQPGQSRADDDNVVVIFGTQHGRYASLPVEHEDKDYAFELLQHNV